jgi:Fe-S-cluster containining protein
MNKSSTQMKNTFTPIALNDRFRFTCSAQVPCFNACCRDLNQLLTPYDILRLKNHLRMTSSDFLEHYCRHHSGPESGLPIVALKNNASADLTCPFVTENGCSVYKNRPSSCRMYPLARAISQSRSNGAISERYMLIRESHCLGFSEGQTQTVRQWMLQQELDIYNNFNDRLLEIISLKNRFMPGPLETASSHMFYLALYDLDRFRFEIHQNGLLKDFWSKTEHSVGPDFSVGTGLPAEADWDDTALLRVGLQWVKHTLFGVDPLIRWPKVLD